MFVHVKDIDRAVNWYAKLFGVSVPPGPYDKVFSMQLNNLTLLLDAHRSDHFQPSELPLFTVSTEDVDQTYEYLNNNNIVIVGEIERFPDVSFVTLLDSEGNQIMIVQE
ncbi:VOC family protein [Lederbergia citrisecunda]|uniref:VOC family protein n=1 Tax=Lederbergia citrisecunda TaxID=2833583 RepID=UPI0032E7F843